MPSQEWISIASSIATLCTVVILFFTLREMSKQRKESYKPYITILRRNFYGYYKKFGSLYIPTIWSESELRKEEVANIVMPNATFLAVNIGLGPAKEIEIEWELDFVEIIENIKKINDKNSVPLKLTLSDSGWLTLENDSAPFLSVNMNAGLKSPYEFLTPVSLNKENMSIRTAPGFHILVSLWMHAYLYSFDKDENTTLEPINFKLIIKFKDVADNIHIVTFNGDIHINIMYTNFDEGNQAFFIQFEFSKDESNKQQFLSFGNHLSQ